MRSYVSASVTIITNTMRLKKPFWVNPAERILDSCDSDGTDGGDGGGDGGARQSRRRRVRLHLRNRRRSLAPKQHRAQPKQRRAARRGAARTIELELAQPVAARQPLEDVERRPRVRAYRDRRPARVADERDEHGEELGRVVVLRERRARGVVERVAGAGVELKGVSWS